MTALAKVAKKIQKNGTNGCFVLKCDVQKFFDSVDHAILLSILKKRINDGDAMWLLKEIIESFSSVFSTPFENKGVPIGNLTSQLFANIYMNEFDQFMKHDLKMKHYVRYTDDFVVVADNREYLDLILPRIKEFLEHDLRLKLHPKKVSVRKFHKGVDFLGYIVFPDHRLIRSKTKRRMVRNLGRRIKECRRGEISKSSLEQCLQSYLGVLSHANTHKFSNELGNQLWFC